MKDIRKLKCWSELQNNGFELIRFKTFGKVQCIGASNGKITIEPHCFKSSNKSYYISGHLNKPITRKFYVYDFRGVKTEQYETTTFINEFYKPREILKTILQ